MRKKTLIALILALTTLAGCSSRQNDIAATEITKDVPMAVIDYADEEIQGDVGEFSYKLFGQEMEENCVMSPLSAYLAVGMAAAGSKGDTRAEFNSVLGDDFARIADEYMDSIPTQTEEMKVLLANSAWIDNRISPKENWLTDIKAQYKAKGYQTDLSSEKTMKDVNAWIDENTGHLIPEFLDEPMEEAVVMALFNTVYFDGKWKYPFEAYATKERDFFLEDGDITKVNMMSEHMVHRDAIVGKNCMGVVLPYADDRFAYVALMPTDDTTIREMYNSLSQSQMKEMIAARQEQFMNLRLPKYEVEADVDLIPYFEALGVEKAFTGEADFSGLAHAVGEGDLAISIIRQSALLQVDELGTKAAAVTQVAIKETAMEITEQPVEMYFDRPFFYMIYDMKEEIPLFMGIYDKPGES